MEKILDGPNVGYCSDSESDDDKFASNPLTHPNTSLTVASLTISLEKHQLSNLVI